MRKILYVAPLLGALAVGFAAGSLHRSSNASAARHALYYVDPMHPAYRSPHPGTAPDCGMQLVPVYAEEVVHSLAAQSAAGSGRRVDAATRQLLGIQLTRATRHAESASLRVFGRVAADESRIYQVSVGTDAFVKQTRNDAVGDLVRKDQRLAQIYSPEFLSVVGGYLSANERSPGITKDNVAPLQNAASAQARADRLRYLGMSDAQILEVSETKKIPEDVYLVSPVNGIILTRNISAGLRFEKHSELYRIADLSHIWVLAEVFDKDVAAFRPGALARVTLPETGETFRARVSHVLPEIDPITHIMKARLEVENPGLRLRPDMFVNVELPARLEEGLSVPVDAVLDSGLSKRVYVQVADGVFDPRNVETGWTSGDRVQIVKGLQEGETVVSAGTFLIDSESRMGAAAGSSAATQHAAAETIAFETAKR